MIGDYHPPLTLSRKIWDHILIQGKDDGCLEVTSLRIIKRKQDTVTFLLIYRTSYKETIFFFPLGLKEQKLISYNMELTENPRILVKTYRC